MRQTSRAILKICIVIRNYYYGQFLREAVDSALAQTHPSMEGAIVDDGPTDEFRHLIEGYLIWATGYQYRVELRDQAVARPQAS